MTHGNSWRVNCIQQKIGLTFNKNNFLREEKSQGFFMIEEDKLQQIKERITKKNLFNLSG
jgi:hypothetical protein